MPPTVTGTVTDKSGNVATWSTSWTVAATDPTLPAGYTRLYADDFTTDKGWTKETGKAGNTNSYDQPANAVFTPAGLELWYRRQSNPAGVPITTADVLGKHVPVPQYFWMSVTGTFPLDVGTWSCLGWLRPHDGGAGEIDLMEVWPSWWTTNPTNPPVTESGKFAPRVQSSIHAAYGTPHKQVTQVKDFASFPADPAAVHTYTMLKVPGQITTWMDGVKIRDFKRTDVTSQGPVSDWWDAIYEAPGRLWYPRLTAQAGGQAGCDPLPSFTAAKITATDLQIWTP